MFSPHLFTHVYDIDTLIAAFCSEAARGDWVLDTRAGQLTPPEATPGEIPADHRFTFTPLPQGFLASVFEMHAFTRMTEEQQGRIRAFIAAHPTLLAAQGHLEESFEGGWVRERIKEAILDWLDSHDLIPPSMRHANPQALFAAPPPPPKKVRIS